MKKIAIFIGVLISQVSCFHQQAQDDKAINQIITETKREMEDLFGARVSSRGGACLHGIRRLSLGFYFERNLSLEEARAVIVKCSDVFLKNINSNPLIRPYLVTYPFTENEISLSFSIFVPKQRPGLITSFGCCLGKIDYCIREAPNEFRRYEETVIMHKETFDEARRIVEHE